jgi:ribonuclease BN (tRNA processing enzyme)
VKLTVLGAGPSFPNPGGASSSYLIEHDGSRLLVDCGHGSCARLLAAVDPRTLDAVLLSHLHPDHFFDLVPLTYAFRFRYTGGPRIPLWLPPDGIPQLQRIFRALDLDADFLAAAFEPREFDPSDALSVGHLCVCLAPARHFVPTYAMRITPAGSASPALGYTSDTGPSDSISRIVRNADLALVEATYLDYPPDEREHGHLTAAKAGQLAQSADVKRLVLTHFPDSQAAGIMQSAKLAYPGPITLAREGESYEL